MCPKGCHLPHLGEVGRSGAHLECLVLALGGLHEQVGPFAVAQAVSRALEQQEGQGQLGEGPLHPGDSIEQLHAEAHFHPCPADEGVRVIKVDLKKKRERFLSLVQGWGTSLLSVRSSFCFGPKS